MPWQGYLYILDDFHRIAHRIVPCKAPGSAARIYAPSQATFARQGGADVSDDDLGTQTMFGLTVTGHRQTTTYPPGTYQGNDVPVVRSEETWRSDQYDLDFLRKTTTPEGETTTDTVTNFTAGEPDPALFQVPPGYQIVEETGPFTITIPYQPR